jgi:hypothetical protein
VNCLGNHILHQDHIIQCFFPATVVVSGRMSADGSQMRHLSFIVYKI